MSLLVVCGSWISFNGEEYQCQWPKDHLGAHSCWAGKEKIKWMRLKEEDEEMNIMTTCPCCKQYHETSGCRSPKPLPQEPSLLDRMAGWIKQTVTYGDVYSGSGKELLAEYEAQAQRGGREGA